MTKALPRPPTAAPDEVPPVLDGKYRLEERLGEGAHGIVFRAVHLGLTKGFAVKLLKPEIARNPLSLARFRREAEALGRLRHPHVVEVTDFGIDSQAGLPYLVMEPVAGIPLSDLLGQSGPLPPERALLLLERIAAALDAAHAQGILHRDLKPANILVGNPAALREDGMEAEEREIALKVLDFGLAELFQQDPIAAGTLPARAFSADEQLTSTGALLGTPLYAAPEILRQGASSRASDLYSFGVIAYEMLTGEPPFRGAVAEVVAGHLEREPPRPAALPDEVWRALRELLDKDPAGRPLSAAEAVRQLRRAIQRSELARWRHTQIPRRAGVAALLSLAALFASLVLPGAGLPAAERGLYDLRMRTAPSRPPDPRLLLITLDEASLGKGEVPLADRADELGRVLDRLFAAGARGVAVDLLLPESWSRSQPFSDFVLRHAAGVTLAAFSRPDGRVVGTDCVAGLTAAALGGGAAELFGFVNLDEDPDGATRRARLRFVDRSGNERPSWAARAAGTLRFPLPAAEAVDGFWIDQRIDWRRYDRISWRDLPNVLERDPGRFRGRLVLVGGDLVGSGDDYHRLPRHPATGEAVSGLTLQALIANTLLAGLPLREGGRLPVLSVMTLVSGAAAAGVLSGRRPARAALLLVLLCLAYLAVTFLAFRRSGLILPASGPVLIGLASLFGSLLLRRLLPPVPCGSREP